MNFKEVTIWETVEITSWKLEETNYVILAADHLESHTSLQVYVGQRF